MGFSLPVAGDNETGGPKVRMCRGSFNAEHPTPSVIAAKAGIHFPAISLLGDSKRIVVSGPRRLPPLTDGDRGVRRGDEPSFSNPSVPQLAGFAAISLW